MTAERQDTPSVSRAAVLGIGRHPISSSPILAWVRINWALLAVFLAFAVAAIVVPTLEPVATTDDWAYTRSAQILLEEGRLTVFPVVAATAVFQIVWGALFGFIFEPTFGVFRISTVAITALGGLALYGLCRDLNIGHARGALGVATYLFNPLVFVLAFTFMTDAHFMALLVIATWLYAKALQESSPPSDTSLQAPPALPKRPGRLGNRFRMALANDGWRGGVDGRLITAGSGVAALAFLTRQQGALIVPAVFAYLVLSRRLRLDRAGALLLVQLFGLPLLAIGGYYLWLRYGNDVPHVQASFFREIMEEGWTGTWWLLRRLTVVELMYLGFFTLPLIIAALPPARRLVGEISPRGWIMFALWQAVLLIGVTALWVHGGLMPYIGQFLGSGGPGAPDILGSRPILLGTQLRAALTVVCLAASLLLGLIAARAMGAPPGLARSRAALVLSVSLGQVVGVMPPSYHYIGWAAGSLDRYLLPLVPLAIVLALWGLGGMRIVLPLGWLVVGALALFAVVGTRDYLVFMRAVWSLGEEALAEGVPLDRLDAGSSWDGYHLYEYGLEHRIRSRTPKGGPWWVYFYAPATDSAYVVASKPMPRYRIVTRRPYSSWLQGKPTHIYLLRRWDAPWPPRPAAKPIVTRPGPSGLERALSSWMEWVTPPRGTSTPGSRASPVPSDE